ncbi:MAG: tyrosine-type recombinase/integrase [Anaerolineae bacterium]
MVNIALPLLIEQFLGTLAESPCTYKTYCTGLNAWQNFLMEEKWPAAKLRARQSPTLLTLVDVTEQSIAAYKDWLQRKPGSKFTRQTYFAAVTAFIRYAMAQDWLPDFSLERAKTKAQQIKLGGGYPMPKIEPRLPEIVEYWDNKPLPAADTDANKTKRLNILRARAFVHTLWSTACRMSEARGLDRKQVADGRRDKAIVKGKGNKERYIYLTAEARTAIRTYCNERADEFEPLFISHGRGHGRRLSITQMSGIVYIAAAALGLDVSPHDFRHYRASQMLNDGVPLEVIQDLLGHSDISTTRTVYAKSDEHVIRRHFDRAAISPREASHRAAVQAAAQ